MLCDHTVRGKKVVALRSSHAPPRVLLLHGAGGNHHSFDELLAHLGLEYIVPSLPGRAGSEGPPLTSVAELALWLADFIREAELGPLVVCGYSFGGAVAIELALCQQEVALDLRALVLMATGARLRVNSKILQAMERAAEGGQPASLGHVFSKGTSKELIRRHEEEAQKTPPATTLVDWKCADQFDRMSDLGRISLPTLVLSAENDVFTPSKYALYLQNQLAKSTHVELAACGHMFPVEAAQQSALQMRQFITPLFSSED
jgi:pimeloyl-ACP methyl ester carboxylesterase